MTFYRNYFFDPRALRERIQGADAEQTGRNSVARINPNDQLV